MPKALKSQATYAILFATMLWGMTFSFIKDAVHSLPPFNFLFLRFGIAAGLLGLILFKKIKINGSILTKGFILGLFLGGTVIFQTIGLQYTTASTASFITGLSVVIVALLNCFIEKQAPKFHVILAVSLALLGIALITITNNFSFNPGDIWILLCAFCFALYIIFAGKFSHLNETVTLTFLQMSVIFLLTFCFAFSRQKIYIPHQLDVWVSILFCAIFASIIAFLLQLKYQKYVSSTKTAIIFASEPIFATITAIIYLRESIDLQFVIGALLIFFAIIIAEKPFKRKVMPQE